MHTYVKEVTGQTSRQKTCNALSNLVVVEKVDRSRNMGNAQAHLIVHHYPRRRRRLRERCRSQ